MGYYLIRSQCGRWPVSHYLENMVAANARGYKEGKIFLKSFYYLSIYEITLMRALAAHAHDDGTHVFPYQKTLAKECHCTEKTVRRVLAEFKKRKWITIKRTIRGNVYQILKHGAVDPELAVQLAREAREKGDFPQQTVNSTVCKGEKRPFANGKNDRYNQSSSENLHQRTSSSSEDDDDDFSSRRNGEGNGKEKAEGRFGNNSGIQPVARGKMAEGSDGGEETKFVTSSSEIQPTQRRGVLTPLESESCDCASLSKRNNSSARVRCLDEFRNETRLRGLPDTAADWLFDIYRDKPVTNVAKLVASIADSGSFPSQKESKKSAVDEKRQQEEPAWTPPGIEEVIEHAKTMQRDIRSMPQAATRRAERLAKWCCAKWVGNKWTWYGQKIDSTDQWKALMVEMAEEFNRLN